MLNFTFTTSLKIHKLAQKNLHLQITYIDLTNDFYTIIQIYMYTIPTLVHKGGLGEKALKDRKVALAAGKPELHVFG